MPMQEIDNNLETARATFATDLPARTAELREALALLQARPDSISRLEVVLRRLHAIASGLRATHSTEAVERLERVKAAVIDASGRGPLDHATLRQVAEVLEELPRIAGTASLPSGVMPTPAGPDISHGCFVVFGKSSLEAALTADAESVDVEVTEDPDDIQRLVQEGDPDAVVIDADLPHGSELAETLAATGVLLSTPLVVVGSFRQPESAARFVALGAARVLARPVSPDALCRTLAEIRESEYSPRPVGEPIGDVTVAALSERIAAEVRRGLADAVEPGTDRVSVPLGDGTDVLAAVWASVARIRELMTMRSGGAIRFRNDGPEGAVPVAPWTGGDRHAGADSRRRARRAQVSLRGRKMVVADDDPAVVWFLTDLLKQAGASVLEAHDGQQALDHAQRSWPDLVVSDVLMPRLDGFSLCKKIKRDPAIRDVPVVLLSWKEDLLQRLRELGSDADGFLRKEAAASVVVERLQEVLRPRARVEARLDRGGEVKGRLDGITPRLILQLVCERGSNARVIFRDAVYLYEVEVRAGCPVAATRTDGAGRFDRGTRALGALLGVSAGRFVVTPDDRACRRDFEGELRAVLDPIVQSARAAQQALSAERLAGVEQVAFDAEALSGYLEATPAPASEIVRRLMEGVSPGELLQSGTVSLQLLEAVLADAARHGGVVGVTGAGGADLLTSVVKAPASPATRTGPRLNLPTPSPMFTFELSPEPAQPEPQSMAFSASLAELAAPLPAQQLESARAMPAVDLPAATNDPGPVSGPDGSSDPARLESSDRCSVDDARSAPDESLAPRSAPDESLASRDAESDEATREQPAGCSLRPVDDPEYRSESPCRSGAVDSVPSPGAGGAPGGSAAVGNPIGAREDPPPRNAASEIPSQAASPAAIVEPDQNLDTFLPSSGAAPHGSVASPAGAAPVDASSMAPEVAPPSVPALASASGVDPAPPVAPPDPRLPLAKKIAFPAVRIQAAAPAPTVTRREDAPLPESPPAKKIAFPPRAAPPATSAGADVTSSPEPAESSPLPASDGSLELDAGEGPEVRASSPAPPVMPRLKKLAFPRWRPAAEVAQPSSRHVPETSEALDQEDTPDPFTPEPSVSTSLEGDLPKKRVGIRSLRLPPALTRKLASAARVGGMTAGAAFVSFLLVRNVVPALSAPAAPAAAASATAGGTQPATTTPAAAAASVAMASPPATKPKPPPASGLPEGKTEQLAIPPGFALDQGRGLLEVATSDREEIHIDGEWMGRGPLRRYPIQAGKHQVQIKLDGKSRTYDVTVSAGRRTRLSVTGS